MPHHAMPRHALPKLVALAALLALSALLAGCGEEISGELPLDQARVRAAEAAFGLDFTNAERQLLLPDLLDQRAAYVALRAPAAAQRGAAGPALRSLAGDAGPARQRRRPARRARALGRPRPAAPPRPTSMTWPSPTWPRCRALSATARSRASN
jgi:hypothetical protein